MTRASFSVVMPIHNEARLLPYSLPSVFGLNPDEVILIFDRCTDGSISLSKKITAYYNALRRTKVIEASENCDWKCRIAYLRRLGYKIAKNDIILTTDADIILDSQITDHILSINGIMLVVFERIDYPLTYQNIIIRLLQRLPSSTLYRKFTGIYVFSKRAWLETEDLDEVKNIERAEDTHLQLAISKKYPTKFVLTKTYHLRPKETSKEHYRRGKLYWQVAHRPMWLTILSAVILLRPSQIRGYIHERFG